MAESTLLPNSLKAQGRTLPPRRDAAPTPAQPGSAGMLTSPVAAIPQVPNSNPPMQTYIRPSARDRWMSPNLHFYTPQMVENTARSAMTGNLLAQWMMFDLMEQTWPRLVKNLNELKDAVIDLDWTVQAYAPRGEKPSAEAQRRAKLAEAAIWDMSPDATQNENDFEDTLRDILDAIGKGVSVLEIDWEQRPVDGALLWRPRATRWVHPRYYGYPPYGVAQDRLMLNMIEVASSNNGVKPNEMWQPFPDNCFLVSVMKQKTGHPLNAAMLRILGFFWAAQNFTWEWFVNLAQIFGMPLRWAEYDPTQKNLLDLISNMLAQMGSKSWAAFPAGTQLHVEKGVENARDNPQKVLIDQADEICDILILGQTLTTSQGQRGSQALGTIHKDVRDEKIHAIGKRGIKVINDQLLPAFCRLNFGDDSECPSLATPAEEEDSAIDRAKRDLTIIQMGVDLPGGWFRKRHSIPEPEAGEEMIKGQTTPAPGDNNFGAGNSGEAGAAMAQARGMDSLEALTNRVMEDLSGVQAKWLGAVKPVFREIVAMAKDGNLSDAQFIQALERAQKHFPELFHRLDRTSLARAMEKAMAAAAVNGAVAGMIARRTP